MKIGFSGHQYRPNLDVEWIRAVIDEALSKTRSEIEGFCSLAAGCDQIFAKCVLDRGGKLTVVVPRDDYESFFLDANDVSLYRDLRRTAARCIELHDQADPQTSFLSAGHYIVDAVEAFIVVWDGEPAKGHGGTADIVKFADERNRPLLHINPNSREVTEMNLWHSRCS